MNSNRERNKKTENMEVRENEKEGKTNRGRERDTQTHDMKKSKMAKQSPV